MHFIKNLYIYIYIMCLDNLRQIIMDLKSGRRIFKEIFMKIKSGLQSDNYNSHYKKKNLS